VQSLTGTKSAPPVVFRPGNGASVYVKGILTISADQVEFRDVHIDGWKAETDADSVTFRNVKHNWFGIMGSNVSVLGGEVVPDSFPLTADYDPLISEGRAGVPPRNVLIDGVWFHDWTTTDANSDAHVECLQVGAGENVTIRNSRFERCATHDIFVRSWGGTNGGVHNVRNFLIENNVFAVTQRGYYSIQFLGDLNVSGCTNNVLRYNTALQEFHSSDCDVSWIGNLGYKWGTGCHGTYRFNVWFKDEAPARTCGSSDRGLQGDPGFIDRARGDYHLRTGSTAINAGDASAYPSSDIDGQARPMGGAPDAGADEAA
jgi:hypothetical protein